ncbi:MAG: cation:dicarboxylase symporter family transporter [Rhabdochlamydiaceae bacterium]|nr:cation:dicarboxylase symporter family transporter [Rhabdochlamydiaceae bacterium]
MKFFRISLALQMAIATVLGILCGLIFGDLCEALAPYGKAYIMILKVTAVPYLIGAIIHGVGQLSSSQAKMILKKGILFIGITLAINISMIYLTYYVYPQPKTAPLVGYIAGNVPSIQFSELLIPENIFYDLANNIIPSIVIFSLLIGIALMYLKEKLPLMNSLQNLVEALTRITGWIARITPIGTFIIIANQAGTIQFATIKQVSTYIILYIVCISIIVFWIFPRITNMLSHIPSHTWLKQLFPILLLAYTTNVVIVCLPYIIELLHKEMTAIDPTNEKAQTQIQGTVSIIFNLPLGSLFITMFVFFASIFYNTILSLSSQAELFFTTFLTSLGAVGIGSWINSLTFILDSLGLPIEALNLYLTTIPFTSGFQAMTSVIQIASISLLITLACRKRMQFHFMKIVKGCLITFVPVIILYGLIKTFNPLPEIKNEKKSIFELSIASDIKVTIHDTQPAELEEISTEDTFQRILRTKTLRVGYVKDAAPFAFANVNKDLVGYDVAFAYELAYDLGCDLELIPMTYANVIKELKSNTYDIAMSALSINEERLKSLAFTNPYLEPKLVFVTIAKNKNKFKSLGAIQDNTNISIAVLKGSSYEKLVGEYFPEHPMILLDNYDQFAGEQGGDVMLWEDSEAMAWSLRHKQFRIIFPEPGLGKDAFAYAIRANNTRFLSYLNQWMQLKNIQGYRKKQYELWVQGKTEIAAHPAPRWSLVQYLGWVQ